MSKNLLKEAIADAKAVRETAIANAKLALEEAFTPKLQSMLSAKLQEDEHGDDEELEDDMHDEMKTKYLVKMKKKILNLKQSLENLKVTKMKKRKK